MLLRNYTDHTEDVAMFFNMYTYIYVLQNKKIHIQPYSGNRVKQLLSVLLVLAAERLNVSVHFPI